MDETTAEAVALDDALRRTDGSTRRVVRAEVERLRRIAAAGKAITVDPLAPWGASDYGEYWFCFYCSGRCKDEGMDDEPGDWGHTADCPWLALRRELHPQ